jgi:hypothetical protein
MALAKAGTKAAHQRPVAKAAGWNDRKLEPFHPVLRGQALQASNRPVQKPCRETAGLFVVDRRAAAARARSDM